MLTNKNAINTNQTGYTALFEKDFMASPHRINDVSGQSFQISTSTDALPGEKWHASQDKSIEQVTYCSPKDPNDPTKAIDKVEFEGWRRYVPERRPTEGSRIIFHIQSLQKQSKLARVIDDKNFREIGWLEPIVAVTENPILAVNFREASIEENPDYIRNLFSRIAQVEKLPNAIIDDLENVIALNSIDRFMKRMIECGFSEYEYAEALKLIRPCAFKNVASPFYVAALFCRNNRKFKEARRLLKEISKKHWQYEEGIDLERALYGQEIREDKQTIQQLQTEINHLRSRGSIADITHSVQSTEVADTQQSIKLDVQQETEIVKKATAQRTQKCAETLTPIGQEITPYFQGLPRLLATRQKNQQLQTEQVENSPKKHKRQRG